MENLFTPMTREEFMTEALTNPDPDANIEDWAVSAATCVMMIATQPESMRLDVVITAMQNLALRLPPQLVNAGSMHWRDIVKQDNIQA